MQNITDKGIATFEPIEGWVHQLDPFLIQISQHFGVRWYGLAYLFGFFTGYLLMVFIARRSRGSLPEKKVGDFILAVVIGTMVGGRVGYMLFYSPEILIDFSANFPFWGALRVWEGGMASHGGILGIILAALWFAREHRQNWMNLGDLATLGGSIGIFCGRIANFINGELYGRPVHGPLAWAVKFPSEAYLWLKYDAEKPIADVSPDLLPRLTESVSHIGVSQADWLSWCSQVRSSLPARAQIQTAIEKIIQATQTGNETVIASLQPVLTARHPSQLYAALLEGALLFLIVFLFWRKPRKPGVVGGVWLTSYALVRMISEEFRMPDAHIGFQMLGLTRGQWLSIGMLIASLAVLVVAWRRKAEPIAGWGR